MAIGAVTALSPDEHMTGILTAREIEYAAANVGVAWKLTKYQEMPSSIRANNLFFVFLVI